MLSVSRQAVREAAWRGGKPYVPVFSIVYA
jgi:hypothetical protein